MLAWESLAFHPPIGAGTEVVWASTDYVMERGGVL